MIDKIIWHAVAQWPNYKQSALSVTLRTHPKSTRPSAITAHFCIVHASTCPHGMAGPVRWKKSKVVRSRHPHPYGWSGVWTAYSVAPVAVARRWQRSNKRKKTHACLILESMNISLQCGLAANYRWQVLVARGVNLATMGTLFGGSGDEDSARDAAVINLSSGERMHRGGQTASAITRPGELVKLSIISRGELVLNTASARWIACNGLIFICVYIKIL